MKKIFITLSIIAILLAPFVFFKTVVQNDISNNLRTLFNSFFLAVSGMVYLVFSILVPKLMYSNTLEERNEKVKKIENSLSISSINLAGKVGPLYLKGPLIKVSIFEDGIVLKPVIVGKFGIYKNEIKDVEINKNIFDYQVIINHNSSFVDSPIKLSGFSKDDLNIFENYIS